MRGQKHAVVQLLGEVLQEALQGDEVEDEPRLRLEAAFDDRADAVVVAVQGLAAVPGERDEMRCGEHQIFLGDRDLEHAAHCGGSWPVTSRHTSSASHSSRCWA